jgi:hypothetical protein
MSATDQHTKSSGDIEPNWRQETPTKLAHAELEQEMIVTFTLQAHLAK